MNIGIIGAGNIGGTLTRRLTALGHKVYVANSRGPESLKALAEETGATAATAHEAARHGEIVIVTIPECKIPDLPKDLFDGVSHEVVVVDTGNYYAQFRDGRIDAIEDGMPESQWVESQLNRPVIKAFNNIGWPRLLNSGLPRGTAGRIAIPVSGDDLAAKYRVIDLCDELGFDGVDAGGLDDSWRQEPGTPVYAANYNAHGVRHALREAKPGRKPEWRATPGSTLGKPAERSDENR